MIIFLHLALKKIPSASMYLKNIDREENCDAFITLSCTGMATCIVINAKWGITILGHRCHVSFLVFLSGLESSKLRLEDGIYDITLAFFG